MVDSQLQTLLLKNTSLSESQLQAVLNTSFGGDSSLGDHLENMEDPNIDDILNLICQELGVEHLKDIPINDISVDLVRNIPINYAKNHEILPFKEESEFVSVLVSNPIDLKPLDDLRSLYNKPTKALVSTSNRILEAINKVYEKSTAALEGLDDIEEEEGEFEEQIEDLLDAGDDDAPVIKLVRTLLFRAVKEKASDIHIEPYERDMVVRFRIDGSLYDIFKPPKKLQNAITSRIKVLANLNIAEKRLPQDGRIPLKMAGKDIDVRLNTVPTAHGERLVMRLQDRSNVILNLNQLGFPADTLERIYECLEKSYGIILVTGPTGSGKSTTLYSCLNRINAPDRNIITVEDPVEQRIHGIGQIQVASKIGLTFASGLRAILRQDPDIIMVGEIRDLETAEIAINASLTGHLVLSTIHTNDSSGVVPRLMDMGCEPFLISSSLVAVVAQRLVRVLCPHCKAPYSPTDVELATLDLTREQTDAANVHKPIGCNQCNHKGYIGRSIISEVLTVSDKVRSLILQRLDGGTIKKQAIADGMRVMRDDGINKILKGITSIEEVLSSTQLDE
ncbi:MAG: type II secretion system ATPase GspE [Bdellovibrionota bacterium]|nr:type II secretion system ATPase GspE [Bdellovibrionota bacterium]